MRRLLALALTATVAAGCGGSSAGPSSAGPTASANAGATPSSGAVLPTGKELITLDARTYRSPDGFVPAVTVDVPTGWSSIHRYDDAFDVTQPDPGRDSPAVAVIWITPAASTAAAALAAVRTAAQAGTGVIATPVTGRIGAASANGLDLTDGTGTVVESVRRGIALDAEKGQRLRVLAADLGGKPLLVVVLVPVAAGWDAMLAKAQPLIDATRPA